MRALSPSILIITAAIMLVGAGCAPRRPAANTSAANISEKKETPAAKTPATPAPAADVTADDLNRLKSDIQGSNFDDFTSLNE